MRIFLSPATIAYEPFGYEGEFRLVSLPSDLVWTHLASSNLAVVITCDGRHVMRSIDGIGYTKYTNALPIAGSSIVFGAGVFVVMGVSATRDVMVSADQGLTWTQHVDALPSSQQWKLPIWVESLGQFLVVAATSNVCATSSDGVTWTSHNLSQTPPGGGTWCSLVWDGTNYVMITSAASDLTFTSPTGSTWTNRIQSVTLTGGILIANLPSSGIAAVYRIPASSTGANSRYSLDHGVTFPYNGMTGGLQGYGTNGFDVRAGLGGENPTGRRYYYITSNPENPWRYSAGDGYAVWASGGPLNNWDVQSYVNPWVDATFYLRDTVLESAGTSLVEGWAVQCQFESPGRSTATSTAGATSSVFRPMAPVTGTATGSHTHLAYTDVSVNTSAIDITLKNLVAAFVGAAGTRGGVAMHLPRLRFSSEGGPFSLALTLPSLTMSLDVMSTSVASMDMRLPRMVLGLYSTAGLHGNIALTLPRLVSAFEAAVGGIGEIVVTLSKPSILLEAGVGTTASLGITLPLLEFETIGYSQISGTISIVLPHLVGEFRARLVGAQVLTMVMNTITNSVVTYEQYPYNSFAKFNDMYLAAGPSGLYRVDIGKMDDTTPIAARLSVGQLMFGSEFIKRISDFYAGMRSEGDIIVTVTADENVPYDYALSPYDVQRLKQRRTWIGKGMRGKYFNFSFANTDGADFDFDTMNVAAVATSRRI